MTAFEIAVMLAVQAKRAAPEAPEDFERLGIPTRGGCHGCGLRLAAYSAHPQKSGFWACWQCSTQPITTMSEWYEMIRVDDLKPS